MTETPQQAEAQYYVVCSSDFFIESRTSYVCRLDTLEQVLSDPAFLEEFDYRFDCGTINGIEVTPCTSAPGAKTLTLSYTDQFGDNETTDFFLLPVRIFS